MMTWQTLLVTFLLAASVWFLIVLTWERRWIIGRAPVMICLCLAVLAVLAGAITSLATPDPPLPPPQDTVTAAQLSALGSRLETHMNAESAQQLKREAAQDDQIKRLQSCLSLLGPHASPISLRSLSIRNYAAGKFHVEPAIDQASAIRSAGLRFCPSNADDRTCIKALPTKGCQPDANLICNNRGKFASIPPGSFAIRSPFWVRIDYVAVDGTRQTLNGGPVDTAYNTVWQPGAVKPQGCDMVPAQKGSTAQ